jgi:4-amino-4-deoxy-L-arabinose transferase-like glycosyltransferase
VFLRLFFSQTLQVDDAEQIRHAQYLLLGYPIPQPPLYSWLSWGMFQIFGTGLLALTLLKYTIISLTFWFTWLVSGQLFQHLQTRHIATFSYLLMPSFAWHMHQGFTNTILLGLGIILSLHALLSLQKNISIKNYLYFGFSLGVGLMAKYSFLLFMVPLLLSATTITSFKKIFINQKILLSIGVFILVIGPHAHWLTQHYQEIFLSIDQKLEVTSNNLLLDRIKSAGRFIGTAIAFVIPFSLIFFMTSWREIFNIDKKNKVNDSSLLLGRFYLIIITSVFLLAFFVSMPHFKVRWFHPIMMIFPLWMLTRIERQMLLSRSIMRWFTSIVAIFAVSILLIRIVQVSIGPDLGQYGRLNRPIVESLERIPGEVIKNSILTTRDGFLGAHLLSLYPKNSIAIHTTLYKPDLYSVEKHCLWIWDDDEYFEYLSKPKSIKDNSHKIITVNNGETIYSLHYDLIPAKDCKLMIKDGLSFL